MACSGSCPLLKAINLKASTAEFSSALCPETWKVANGVVEITGQSEAVKNAQALEMKREEEMTDAFGNTVKVKHNWFVVLWQAGILDRHCASGVRSQSFLCGTCSCSRSLLALFGRQIKQPKKTLSNKEKKKKERLKAARRKAGETVSDSEEEW